eukprot:13147549-Alexandrium_andersonii.AAC.1
MASSWPRRTLVMGSARALEPASTCTAPRTATWPRVTCATCRSFATATSGRSNGSSALIARI